MNTRNNRLSDWAYQELTRERGFPYRGAERFIKSLPQDEATEVSGIPFPCEAICFEGENLEVQLQPKRPFWTEAEKTRGAHTKGKKAPKYRSASKRGSERFDAILPPHPEVDQFWQRLIKAKELGDTAFLSRYCYNLDGTPSVIITEGAYKAWALHLLDLACVCLIGVEMGLTSSKEHPEGKRFLVSALERLAKAGFGFIICFDADAATKAPVRRAERKLAASLRQYGVPVESRTGYWKPEEGKGIDDTILHHGGWQAGMTEEERGECFRRGGDRFRQQILGAASPPEWLSEWEATDLPRKHSFYQEAFKALYSDQERPYIYFQKHFWRWCGTHYERVPNTEEMTRIAHFCNTFPEIKTDKKGNQRFTYPYSTPYYAQQVRAWASMHLGVDPNQINPPGLNCLDGILKLEYNEQTQSFERHLLPHSPDLLYTYPPQVRYSSTESVSSHECDRLLSCLDEPQRRIFLKTIGAAFDLETVRKKKGREVRALFLAGEGSNGKDALRYAVSTIFGHQGLVSASLSDFYQFDTGRKFALAKLEGANISWHSENSDAALIDRIQSLKLVTTGQPLDVERKGIDEYPTTPKCALLFNVNQAPRLLGAMEAIKSRYAFLEFSKVYSNNPNPSKGELQADPRFLYDPEFVREQVAPWLLRYCLEHLDLLMKEGINYAATEATLAKVQEETDHIFQFVRDVGLKSVRGARLYATDIYQHLLKWYENEGYLEIEEFGDGRTRKIWHAPVAWGDRLVKGINQIFPRLLKLFKKCRRERDSQGRYYLEGLAFSEDGLNQSEDGLKIVNFLQSNDSERTEADFSNLEQVVSFIKRMGDESKKQLLKSLGLENNVHHLQKADSQKDRVDSGHLQTASVVDSAIDYGSFPAIRSDDLRHKQKQAIACRQRLLECQTRAQLEHFRETGGFTATEIEWVVGHLNVCERTALEDIERIEQLTLEPAVDDSKASQLTLQELQALLLACQTLAQLKEFKQKYPKGGKEAYCTLSAQQQRQIDAVAAQAVPHDVYKYMGKRIEQNDQTLKTGTLVYIAPNAKANRTVGYVFVWLLRGVELGWRCAIAVSRDCLELVKAAAESANLPETNELPGLEGV